MVVRGAPAIGITAAYGMAMAQVSYSKENRKDDGQSSRDKERT